MSHSVELLLSAPPINIVVESINTEPQVVLEEAGTSKVNVDIVLPALGVQGPPGPQGVPGVNSDLTYIHDQLVSSAVWTIVHGLDKYPSVSIVDSAGSLIIGDVSYISPVEVVVSFSAAFSGRAFIN